MDDERQQLPEQKPEGDDQKFSKIFHSIPGAVKARTCPVNVKKPARAYTPCRLLYSSKDLKFQHKILMYIHRPKLKFEMQLL